MKKESTRKSHTKIHFKEKKKNNGKLIVYSGNKGSKSGGIKWGEGGQA